MGIRPEPDSPLESVYQLLFQGRQETRFVEHVLLARAILDAPLQTEEGVQTGNELQEVMETYTRSIFPYHEADSKRDIREMQEALKNWVSSIDHMVVEPMPDPVDQLRSARRRSKAQTAFVQQNKRLSSMVRRRLA